VSPGNPLQLDHIAIGHPDLELAKEGFADLTGCMPSDGGLHAGVGTHNAVASLGDTVYIELISPDPNQVASPMGSGNSALRERLASMTDAGLLAYAIRCDDLRELSNGLSRFEAATPFDVHRQQPDGVILHWQLMKLVNHGPDGFVPFFIDWLDCPHPTMANPLAGEFVSSEVSHTNEVLGDLLNQTGDVAFAYAPPKFTLTCESRRDLVVLSACAMEGF